MPQQHICYTIKRFCTLIFVLTCPMYFATESVFAALPGLCPEPSPLKLNTTLRSVHGPAPQDCYHIQIPTPGTLTLDASSQSSPEVEPRLEFFGEGTLDDKTILRYRQIEQKPRGLVLEFETPGTFFLMVSPEDPTQHLAGYKLRNTFVGKDATPIEGIVICDPLQALRKASKGKVSLPPKVFDNRHTLLPKDVEEEEEEECEPVLLSEGSQRVALRMLASCAFGETDDHGDTALCATPLDVSARLGGQLVASAVGTLRNATHDDEDFFVFNLYELRTLEIEALGMTGGHLTLYNAQGLRLGTSGEGQWTPRLVKTLPSGRYFLRVQSIASAEGGYVLRLEELNTL